MPHEVGTREGGRERWTCSSEVNSGYFSFPVKIKTRPFRFLSSWNNSKGKGNKEVGLGFGVDLPLNNPAQ